MERDFWRMDQAFFRGRPLYPKVIEVLKELNQLGYCQFTMSATFDVEKKRLPTLGIGLSPVTGINLDHLMRQDGELYASDTAKMERIKFRPL